MLLEQEVLQRRDPHLLPLRHGRMAFSPFTFYRGAARIMAHDLARCPQSGLTHIWICGDAHLCNFGMFASRERKLVFDINDFDETAVGPFEWDVKRLAASFIIAGQNNKFSKEECDYACLEMLRTYRESVHEFIKMRSLDLFYKNLPVEDALNVLNFDGGGQSEAPEKKKKKDKKNKDKDGKKDKEGKKEGKEDKKDKKKKKKKDKGSDSDTTLSDEERQRMKKKAKKALKKAEREGKGAAETPDEERKRLKKEKKAKKAAAVGELEDKHTIGLNAPNGLPWRCVVSSLFSLKC